MEMSLNCSILASTFKIFLGPKPPSSSMLRMLEHISTKAVSTLNYPSNNPRSTPATDMYIRQNHTAYMYDKILHTSRHLYSLLVNH